MAMLPRPGERGDSDFLTNEPTFNNILQNQNTEERDEEATTMPMLPVHSVPPVLHQTLFPGAGPAASGSAQKSTDRCAICVYNDCDRRHDCPGKGNRKLCRCAGHVPAPNKVRRTEAQIIANQQKRRNGGGG
ncbi:hypothetical protein B0H16DRAFT_1684129 [Mycena metata]|uniref:Uncharacterized protein n=1 Tax=Mycena metata TaxID=1033252 RepID=A0AAD7NUW8_9AGAR|nr:hypothetical protein B0H16DRAFT_1684129 [Mycena metata]